MKWDQARVIGQKARVCFAVLNTCPHSAEAEIHAAVSTACDGILLRVCIEFAQEKVRLKIILGNSAVHFLAVRDNPCA